MWDMNKLDDLVNVVVVGTTQFTYINYSPNQIFKYMYIPLPTIVRINIIGMQYR